MSRQSELNRRVRARLARAEANTAEVTGISHERDTIARELAALRPWPRDGRRRRQLQGWEKHARIEAHRLLDENKELLKDNDIDRFYYEQGK